MKLKQVLSRMYSYVSHKEAPAGSVTINRSKQVDSGWMDGTQAIKMSMSMKLYSSLTPSPLHVSYLLIAVVSAQPSSV